MNDIMSKDFFLAGNATFTIHNNKVDHFTYKTRAPIFLSLLKCPNNESDYCYIGVLTDSLQVKLTSKSRITKESKSFKVVTWVLKKFLGGGMPEGYVIKHE